MFRVCLGVLLVALLAGCAGSTIPTTTATTSSAIRHLLPPAPKCSNHRRLVRRGQLVAKYPGGWSISPGQRTKYFDSFRLWNKMNVGVTVTTGRGQMFAVAARSPFPDKGDPQKPIMPTKRITITLDAIPGPGAGVQLNSRSCPMM